MDEKERDALTHVLIFIEKMDQLFMFRDTELYVDALRLHQWLDGNYPVQ